MFRAHLHSQFLLWVGDDRRIHRPARGSPPVVLPVGKGASGPPTLLEQQLAVTRRHPFRPYWASSHTGSPTPPALRPLSGPLPVLLCRFLLLPHGPTRTQLGAVAPKPPRTHQSASWPAQDPRRQDVDRQSQGSVRSLTHPESSTTERRGHPGGLVSLAYTLNLIMFTLII